MSETVVLGHVVEGEEEGASGALNPVAERVERDVDVGAEDVVFLRLDNEDGFALVVTALMKDLEVEGVARSFVEKVQFKGVLAQPLFQHVSETEG